MFAWPKRASRCGLGARSRKISGGAKTFQNRGDGSNEDLQVQPNRAAIDVLHVQFHPPFKGNRGSPADLPEAGNPRADTEAAAVPILVKTSIIPQRQPPRAHQAHVPS